jgi:hypothetical protein
MAMKQVIPGSNVEIPFMFLISKTRWKFPSCLWNRRLANLWRESEHLCAIGRNTVKAKQKKQLVFISKLTWSQIASTSWKSPTDCLHVQTNVVEIVFKHVPKTHALKEDGPKQLFAIRIYDSKDGKAPPNKQNIHHLHSYNFKENVTHFPHTDRFQSAWHPKTQPDTASCVGGTSNQTSFTITTTIHAQKEWHQATFCPRDSIKASKRV